METRHGEGGSYVRFVLMIATSMFVMHLATYLNSFRILEHARLSETRLFMTMIMGGAMMIIMLLFMLGMYRNRGRNAAILVTGTLLIALGVWLVRSQVTVGDVDYMEAMIPHHSIAVLTSERANIHDVRVRELADRILEAQRREIREMDWLIADIGANGAATTRDQAEARPIPAFSGAPE